MSLTKLSTSHSLWETCKHTVVPLKSTTEHCLINLHLSKVIQGEAEESFVSELGSASCAGSTLGCTLAQASLARSAFQISTEPHLLGSFPRLQPLHHETAAPGMPGLLEDIFIPKNKLGNVGKLFVQKFRLVLPPGITLLSLFQGKEKNLSPLPKPSAPSSLLG